MTKEEKNYISTDFVITKSERKDEETAIGLLLLIVIILFGIGLIIGIVELINLLI